MKASGSKTNAKEEASTGGQTDQRRRAFSGKTCWSSTYRESNKITQLIIDSFSVSFEFVIVHFLGPLRVLQFARSLDPLGSIRQANGPVLTPRVFVQNQRLRTSLPLVRVPGVHVVIHARGLGRCQRGHLALNARRFDGVVHSGLHGRTVARSSDYFSGSCIGGNGVIVWAGRVVGY